MGFTFVKLILGKIVSSNGGLVFRKLLTKSVTPRPPLYPDNFSLSILGLPSGSYKITAKAKATGLEDSDHSNVVTYIVE